MLFARIPFKCSKENNVLFYLQDSSILLDPKDYGRMCDKILIDNHVVEGVPWATNESEAIMNKTICCNVGA